MGKINNLIIAESEKYIHALLTGNAADKLIFHTYDRAMLVKANAEKIGEHENLSKEEMDILRICASFHETGYVNSSKNHIEESINIASIFLSEQKVDQPAIVHISDIIRATKMPYSPKDKIAEVLCDASMMYIAGDDALEQIDLLYDENAIQKPDFKKRQVFEKGCIESFTGHSYFTEFGKSFLQPRKEAALKRIDARLRRRKLIEGKKEANDKNLLYYGRGVETMFRITARNQINLNSIADNKSNILISVNAIIISIIITMLAGRIGNMSKDIIPILVFLVICLITIIIAILSTRPNIVMNKFTKEDLRKKNVDLIFFGNFSKMDNDEYQEALKEMMKDDDHLYSTLIKNQHSLGKILSKKFRLVKIAYNVFMFGIILTVIVFLLNFLIQSNPA